MSRQFSVSILRLRNPDLSAQYRSDDDFMAHWNSLSTSEQRRLHQAYTRRNQIRRNPSRNSVRLRHRVAVLTSFPLGPVFDSSNINNILGNTFSKKLSSFKRGLVELLPLLSHNPCRPIFHSNSEFNTVNSLLFLSTLIVELTPTLELNILNIKLKYQEIELVIDPLTALPSLYEKVTSSFFRSDQNFLYKKSSNLSLEVYQQNLSSIASNLGKLSSLTIKILLLVLNSGLSGLNPNEDITDNIDELLARPIENLPLIHLAFENMSTVLTSEYLCICHAQGFKDHEAILDHVKKYHKDLINEEVIARQMDRVTYQKLQDVERRHHLNHPHCEICTFEI
jgi:hypothetical protein